MERITLVIGADHRGFALKEFLKTGLLFGNVTVTWLDIGCFTNAHCDYPEFAQAACHAVLQKKADAGILLCGSGIGMALAANRFKKIYSGVAWHTAIAQVAREDDNINMLALPADYISQVDCFLIVEAWLNAQFKKGHYADRLNLVDQHS